MEKENTSEKFIKICKKCDTAYTIGSDNILFYKSVNGELCDYCQKCRLAGKIMVAEKKDWCHNPLK
jgi:hypothetical protein